MKHIQRETFDIERIVMVVVVLAVVIRVEQSGVERVETLTVSSVQLSILERCIWELPLRKGCHFAGLQAHWSTNECRCYGTVEARICSLKNRVLLLHTCKGVGFFLSGRRVGITDLFVGLLRLESLWRQDGILIWVLVNFKFCQRRGPPVGRGLEILIHKVGLGLIWEVARSKILPLPLVE